MKKSSESRKYKNSFLNWIEYRKMNKGAKAFKQIHDGTCSTPKIILIP